MNQQPTNTAPDLFSQPHFSGSDYVPRFDLKRLTGQALKIFTAMQDGTFRTLAEIAQITGYGESSISAQLRNFRKQSFGGHQVSKRPRGERVNGLWEYKLTVNNAPEYRLSINRA